MESRFDVFHNRAGAGREIAGVADGALAAVVQGAVNILNVDQQRVPATKLRDQHLQYKHTAICISSHHCCNRRYLELLWSVMQNHKVCNFRPCPERGGAANRQSKWVLFNLSMIYHQVHLPASCQMLRTRQCWSTNNSQERSGTRPKKMKEP